MATTLPTRIRMTSHDKEAMAAYWRFYEPLHDEIDQELRRALADLPEWAELVRSMSPQVSAEQARRSRELQRAALVDGNWVPYLEDLYAQGTRYAQMGITFLAWYDVIALLREAIRRRLVDLARSDLERANVVGDGMNRFIDIAMSHLGEAYLAAKEAIIAQQQVAIRALSLPILQVGERLLIAPLIGALDPGRARQLIESLLAAIRDRRALAVVIDVTGVPAVDAGVATYLAQACDAARLMGAIVVISGITADMARALVQVGARIADLVLAGDLQEAIASLEARLRPGPTTPGALGEHQR